MQLLLPTVYWATGAFALATPVHHAPRSEATPQLASATWIANVTDPGVSRDSCGSALFDGRALWTCRDTEVYNAESGQSQLPLITNTASWTDLASGGGPDIVTDGPVGAGSTGNNPILLMYGGDDTSLPAFFPVLSDECPESGGCSDGSRWAIWPNSPPLITQADSSGTTLGYTWIPKAHLSGLAALISEPAYTLYETQYTSGTAQDTLPTVTTINESFWAEGSIGYGSYGGVVSNGVAYMYGQTDQDKGTVLAKAPASSVTDVSTYQYYVSGSWTDTMPGINDTSAIIANAGAGGQGTFYYSNYFGSYVWIGQASISTSADFYITTAPAPEGPWAEPYQIYSGPNGDYPGIGAYSIQAHPALLPSGNATENYIYVTYTMQFQSSTYGAYVTPLLQLTFQ